MLDDAGWTLSCWIALIASAAIPLYLAALSRLGPFAGRRSAQFATAVCLATALWLASASSIDPARSPAGWLLGAMVVCTMAIVHLEAWALLLTGYTLGLLLVIADQGPIAREGLARSYRGGGGLEALQQTRVAKMLEARVLTREGSILRLTWRGSFIAAIYQRLFQFLGLRRTG